MSHKAVVQMELMKTTPRNPKTLKAHTRPQVLLFTGGQNPFQMFNGFLEILRLVHSFVFLEILKLIHFLILLFKGFCFSRSLSAVWFLALAVSLNQIFFRDKTNLHLLPRVMTKIWNQKKILRTKLLLAIWAQWSQDLLRLNPTTNQTSWGVFRIYPMSRWIVLCT